MKDKFKTFKKAGIVYVMEEAAKLGFSYDNSDWSNLGQGAAETGELAGANKRIKNLHIGSTEQGYAPVAGRKKLRENVAVMYNDLFREGKESKYSFENVVIAGGGRLAISRIIASLKVKRLGYLVPDYPSYHGILDSFKDLELKAIFLNEEENFKLDVDLIKQEIRKNKIEVLLFSNPSNPSGNVISKKELKDLINFARVENVLLIIDEFYFNFVYDESEFISASEYIEDIEREPVVIISGLSKAWRYSGFRVCWTLGAKDFMEAVSSVGSFLDGGANNPLQKAAEKIVGTKQIKKETKAIRKTFIKKRDYLREEIEKLGLRVVGEAKGAFYLWVDVSSLDKSLNTGDKFFQECLKEKVIVVPGKFFDLNPGKLRDKKRFKKLVRLSYGPNMREIKKGVLGIKRVIDRTL